MQSPVIVKARKTDAAALASLCAEHALYERLPACPADHALRLQRMLDREPNWHAWIAWHGSNAIGYASATIDIATLTGARFLHLDCLYLQEHARAHGIGQRLFDTVRAFAQEYGLTDMQWQTPERNHDAIRFYQRSGAVMLTKQRFSLQLASISPPSITSTTWSDNNAGQADHPQRAQARL